MQPSGSSSSTDVEKGFTAVIETSRSPQERSSAYLQQQQKAPTVANPATLGLFAFASTTLVLSLYNARASDITKPNVVLGMAIFFGGIAQLLAGMWEFPRGNTFGATAFTSYGAFWLSYATIHLPFTGVIAAFDDKHEFAAAIGIFLTSWFFITLWFLIAALRKSIAFIALFGFLDVTFLVLAIGDFTENHSIIRAGGILGVITAAIAYYIGLSDLLQAEVKEANGAVINLPLGVFERK